MLFVVRAGTFGQFHLPAGWRRLNRPSEPPFGDLAPLWELGALVATLAP